MIDLREGRRQWAKGLCNESHRRGGLGTTPETEQEFAGGMSRKLAVLAVLPPRGDERGHWGKLGTPKNVPKHPPIRASSRGGYPSLTPADLTESPTRLPMFDRLQAGPGTPRCA